MATNTLITRLRSYINEDPTTPGFDDNTLSALIDEMGGDVELAAAQLWQSKAASYAELVTVQEGSSRRELGNLQTQAIKMADYFRSRSKTGATMTGVHKTRTRKIERP